MFSDIKTRSKGEYMKVYVMQVMMLYITVYIKAILFLGCEEFYNTITVKLSCKTFPLKEHSCNIYRRDSLFLYPFAPVTDKISWEYGQFGKICKMYKLV